LACWLEQLEEFDFQIVHRKGNLHSNADALSRLPSHMVAVTSLLPAYSTQDLQNCQLEDDLVGSFF